MLTYGLFAIFLLMLANGCKKPNKSKPVESEWFSDQPVKKPVKEKPVVQAKPVIKPVQMMSDYLGLKPSAVMASRTRKRLLALPHLS
jgi:hypothetical protein